MRAFKAALLAAVAFVTLGGTAEATTPTFTVTCAEGQAHVAYSLSNGYAGTHIIITDASDVVLFDYTTVVDWEHVDFDLSVDPGAASTSYTATTIKAPAQYPDGETDTIAVETCVIEEPNPTTTVAAPTTTAAPVTTVVEPSTTVVEPSTTIAEPTTTAAPTTAAPTTTVAGGKTLPKTGGDGNVRIILIAIALIAAGLLVRRSARR
jgi:LPXTG-motif cell wall-anchored protein